MAVTGFSVDLIASIAFCKQYLSSWTVSATKEKRIYNKDIYYLKIYYVVLHFEYSKTFNSVRIAAIPAEISFSSLIMSLKYWQISEKNKN